LKPLLAPGMLIQRRLFGAANVRSADNVPAPAACIDWVGQVLVHLVLFRFQMHTFPKVGAHSK
jgi:hypothetical protein